MNSNEVSSRHIVHLRNISSIIVSILLTLVLHSQALGEDFCHNVVSPVNQSQKWEKTFSTIDTYSKLIDLLNKMSSKESSFTEADQVALQNIDLVSVVKKMSSADVLKLREFIDKLSDKSQNQRNRSQVGHWLSSLSFYFHPEKLYELIKNIKPMSENEISLQEAFSGFLGLWATNKTLISAMDEIPTSMRNKFVKQLRNQINNISLDSEIMTMQDDFLSVPHQRIYRRNLEVMTFILLRSEIKNLKDRLESSKDLKSVSDAIEKYYSVLNEVYSPNRGGYPAQKLLNTAKILQSYFSQHLKINSEYIDLYGSFPNGKAAFKTSDIDIKFSDSFLTRITDKTINQISNEPFSLFFSDMVSRNSHELSKEFFEFWESYQLAEQSLGDNVFNRKPTKPSELLTSLYPPRSYSHDVLDFRWYNPIVLRIFKNKIEIQIVDLTNSRPQYFRFELPNQ